MVLVATKGNTLRIRTNTAAAAAAKSLQSCPTLCDPIDGSPLGSSVHRHINCRSFREHPISVKTKENRSHVCLVTQLCPTLCNPMDWSPPGSSVHGDSPGKNTGVGCHALLQGIFPTQGSNIVLMHCRQILYHLSSQESQNRSYES